MFGFDTTDISNNINLLPDLRQIEIGEVVYFMPLDYNASNLTAQLGYLSRNSYNFEVRTAYTDAEELHHSIGLRLVSLINPYREAYLVRKIEKHTVKTLKESISDTLSFLHQGISEINELPLISKFDRNKWGDYQFSTINFEADSEERYEDNLDNEKRDCIRAISDLVLDYAARFKTMPPLDLIKKTVAGKLAVERGGFSRIKVTWDYKITLPELNNTELRMSPLAKTVYILFLCHPEGIRLKEIGNYRNQLRDIYELIKPGADFELADSRIDELAMPGSESLQQKLSMTRNAVRRAFLIPELAERYMITGTPGGAYSIKIPGSMIDLATTLRYFLPPVEE